MGFTLKEKCEIPKVAMTAFKYRHDTLGLTHLHIQRPDKNRVFSLAFRTNAPNKTGVPHILEHTTLCGSKRYPVRDPFFKMQTRSLANYMNALTGTDYTYYPFATMNAIDFQNLQQVYMDSVFSPLLRELDFKQEGWRLEHQVANDPTTPLEIKGVVFNEMKGQMSMPAYYFWTKYFQSIYPSLEYSAGDPLHIPELTYEQLVNFHQTKYHPDNCFTFSYGDFEASEALDPSDKYLSQLDLPQCAIDTTIRQPLELTKNEKTTIYGPVDPMFDISRQVKSSLTWYVGNSTDLDHSLAWRVLAMLLTDGHASPFYQSLIDSGIGPEFTVNSGIDETPGKLMFTIGLQGLSLDKVDTFKKQVFKTLNEIAEVGFAQNRVDAILHQAELSEREVDANYGMNLLGRVVSRAFHPNDDVMEVLDNEKLIDNFKNKLAKDPDFFKNEIKKMINSPYYEFESRPSQSFEEDQMALESSVLEKKVSVLTDEDRKTILEQGIELQEAQEAPQDVNSLPTVTPNDISKKAPDYPVDRKKINNVDIVVRNTTTQGISYVTALRDVSNLDKSLIPYLSVYTDALSNLGTKTHPMAELEDLIKLNSAGVSVGASSRQLYGRPLGLEVGYSVSGLDSRRGEMLDLLSEVATQPEWANVGKLKAIIDANATNIMNALSQSGHSYAVGRASAAVSSRKALDGMVGGFTYVQKLKELSQMDEKELASKLIPELQKIHKEPWHARVGVTCSPGTFDDALTAKFLENLGAEQTVEAEISNVELAPQKTFVPLQFQVSYVGSSLAGPKIEDKDSAALSILANLLSQRFLHTQIREKGGAYGGGASYNVIQGLFSMYSYRDPSPNNTLDVMQQAGTWATEHNWTNADVAEGKIGVFQGIDSPISPRSEISYALKTGLTLEQRQKRRADLLAVQPSDLNDVAAKYLSGFQNFASAGVCVIGPAEIDSDWSRVEL